MTKTQIGLRTMIREINASCLDARAGRGGNVIGVRGPNDCARNAWSCSEYFKQRGGLLLAKNREEVK